MVTSNVSEVDKHYFLMSTEPTNNVVNIASGVFKHFSECPDAKQEAVIWALLDRNKLLCALHAVGDNIDAFIPRWHHSVFHVGRELDFILCRYRHNAI